MATAPKVLPETAAGEGAVPDDHLQGKVEEPERCTPSKLAWLLAWAVAGIAEGFCNVKCLLCYPKVLADQFVFQNAVVVKMFLGAVGTSMLVQAGMSWLVPAAFEKSREHGKHGYGYWRIVGGLALLGVGMAVAGSGPTMVPPALGARVKTAWALAAGGVAAAVTIGVVDKLLARYDRGSMSPKPCVEAVRVEEVLSRLLKRDVSYGACALAMGLFLIAADIVLEIVVNFKDDVWKYGGPLAEPWPPSPIDAPAWPPMVAGIVVGLGQLPVRMVSSSGMGGTGAFVTAASTLTFDYLFPGRSLQASRAKGFKSFQFVFNFVWVLGGAVLAGFSGGTVDMQETLQPLNDGFDPWRMAVGSFLAVTGARIAGGCTCGHGVSGTSELAFESWIGAMAIFGAAIATRCIIVFGAHVAY